jgi:hypothetical protein
VFSLKFRPVVLWHGVCVVWSITHYILIKTFCLSLYIQNIKQLCFSYSDGRHMLLLLEVVIFRIEQ